MKNSQNKKKIQIVLLVLTAVLTLGIGYASITAVNLIINGNGTASAVQENFKVYFTNSTITDGKGTVSIDEYDATIGYFDITGLSKVGDYAEATYTVLNDSNGIGAEVTLNIESSNTDYFKVTETILDNKLKAGEETTAKVKVEMIKTPVTDSVSTNVTATLTASPIEDAQASGGEQKDVIKPTPLIYTIDGVNFIYINTDISDWTRTYNSFAAAKAASGHPAAIANEVENGIVKSSSIAFEKNGKIYFLKGRINEESLAEKPVYNANVEILKEAFGPDWQSVCTDTDEFICNADGFYIIINDSGLGRVHNGYTCEISSGAYFAQCY